MFKIQENSRNGKPQQPVMELSRITIDEKICNGRPCIRHMGIMVATVIEFILAGESWEVILDNYPMLETADLEACVQFTLEIMNHSLTIRPIPFAA